MKASSESPKSGEPRSVINEVKYSLPDLLLEIKAERSASVFAMEKLDQKEIAKLFKAKSPRGKSKK